VEQRPKLLFVDDEPAIRATLPAVLQEYGFEVTTAATVREALTLIAQYRFDVLISDLNIGEPGDGFTVVSAMRRTQPEATTFILTGYPAFETALEAIRQQVDDYLIKPAEIAALVEKIRQKLDGPRKKTHHIEVRKLCDVLEENKRQIVQRWLAAAKDDEQICGTRLSDAELTDHLPAVIEEIIRSARGQKFSEDATRAAQTHGRDRFRQGCNLPAMVRESRLLHEVVSRVVQENLLGTDISSLIPGIVAIGARMQAFLEESIRAYVHARHAAASESLAGHKGKMLLLISAERELSLLRARVLREAGYAVARADSLPEALGLLEQTFDALLISYSLTAESMAEMTELFRRRNPGSPIIAVTKGKWQDLKIDMDYAVAGEDGPEALLETLETALSRKQLKRVK
jgi:DNA-binding NtrC family response regulator